MKNIRVAFAVITILLATLGIAFAHGGKHKSTDTATGASYARDILPIFEKNCSSCHGSNSPEHAVFMKKSDEYASKFIGPRMDNYSLLSSFIVWPDTGSLMRNLDDGTNSVNGKPGKMYVHLGGSEQERMLNLKLFKSWVVHWTLKDWADISKDDMDKIELRP